MSTEGPRLQSAGTLLAALALAFAIAPVARFAVLSGGASLFHGP